MKRLLIATLIALTLAFGPVSATFAQGTDTGTGTFNGSGTSTGTTDTTVANDTDDNMNWLWLLPLLAIPLIYFVWKGSKNDDRMRSPNRANPDLSR